MRRWLLAVVVTLLVIGAMSSVQAVGCEANEGTPLTEGCLYTITGGDTADPTDGFPVVNTATIPWYTCVSTLDLQDVGYPIAQTFEFDGFQILALQKVMLQYRPDYADTGPCSQFAYLNTMDLLANTYGVNLPGVPAHAVLPEDAGASWAQIEANHLALLDQNPIIKAKFLEKPNWIDLYGLPIAYEAQEIDGNPQGAQVLRAQRAVWRIFNVEAPGTAIGVPHLLNVPDMIKQQFDDVIIPASASIPTVTTPGCIAFSSNRDGDFDIYVMDADGGNAQQLTTDDPAFIPASAMGNGSDTGPAWSPDGTRIAFTKRFQVGPPFRPSTPDVYIMDADGGNMQPLPDLAPSSLDAPAWSPDGNHLAVAHWEQGPGLGSDIRVMEDTGTNPKPLTFSYGNFDRGPTWSPDGTQVAFASRRDGDYDIYVMDADGGNLQQLTDAPGWDGYPDWSPDGTRIAFASDRDGDEEIYVMDVDGGNVQQLTDDPGSDSHPAWSSGGVWIAFDSDRDGDRDIYVMDADGGNVQQLTNDPAFDQQPSWCPS